MASKILLAKKTSGTRTTTALPLRERKPLSCMVGGCSFETSTWTIGLRSDGLAADPDMQARKQDGYEPWDQIEGASRARPVSSKAANASEEFLGQRDDDARRASHVAESVLVLVLGHLSDEFGAVGAQASDSVIDAFGYDADPRWARAA
jgi:hypothetical protein